MLKHVPCYFHLGDMLTNEVYSMKSSTSLNNNLLEKLQFKYDTQDRLLKPEMWDKPLLEDKIINNSFVINIPNYTGSIIIKSRELPDLNTFIIWIHGWLLEYKWLPNSNLIIFRNSRGGLHNKYPINRL